MGVETEGETEVEGETEGEAEVETEGETEVEVETEVEAEVETEVETEAGTEAGAEVERANASTPSLELTIHTGETQTSSVGLVVQASAMSIAMPTVGISNILPAHQGASLS